MRLAKYLTAATRTVFFVSFCSFIITGCGSPDDTASSQSSSSSASQQSSQSTSSQLSTSSSQSSSTPTVDQQAYRMGEFILGMDISYWSEQLDQNTTYVDTDGQTKDLLALFKNHGVNFIRLRTFVDPWAQYGYASGDSCTRKSKPYNDKDDIIRMAQRIKQAGMGLLLDFHYSDTWADPSKQVIPSAWRGASSIDQLANHVRSYTADVLGALKAANALPEMVQVGNEITPGMLIHTPTSSTDCWGNNSQVNSAVNGRANDSNWANLAKLLSAGIQAVNDIDPEILTVLHLENTDNPAGVEWWVNSAHRNGVVFDVLGLSVYEEFQGPASAWPSTFNRLAQNYPQLSFMVAEFNPRGRELADIMYSLPDGRGLGTFFWEPTQSGFWGTSIFTKQGNSFRANASDFSVYDSIVRDYGLRVLP